MPITEAEFLALKHARGVLTEALDFEQRYELLVGNFIALELAFTELSLRSVVEERYAYSELAQALQEANRHIANILTASKSYVDQVVQDFKMVPLGPTFEEEAGKTLSEAYDASLGYRFMEALRNHTQHFGFPATGFTGNIEGNGANDWVEQLLITAKKSELFANPKFKQRYLDELPEKIDLRAMTREYVQRLGTVHIALRELVSKFIEDARQTVEAAITRYGADGRPTLGLCARRLGETDEHVQLLTDWDDVRRKLAEKNGTAPDLWPRRRGWETTSEELKRARLAVGQTVEQAANRVQITPREWLMYEAGLRIPFSVFHMYLLQTEQHPTHSMVARELPAA